MRIFVYEFVTGGGFLHVQRALPSGSLLREGRAMWQALRADFAALPGVELVTMQDARLEAPTSTTLVVSETGEEQELFERLAKGADATLLVAPELDGHLEQRVGWLEAWGCVSLGPTAEFTAIAADKTACNERLANQRIPVPQGRLIRMHEELPCDLAYPAILKPNDGAGSIDIRRIDGPRQRPPRTKAMRIEEHLRGQPCSASFLCRGDRAPLALPPMWQDIDADHGYRYQGGRRITDPQLARRASDQGRLALASLPRTYGFVGVDLILGESSDGSQDYVIEVNPRLTTSYVGLRQITPGNLALAMVESRFGRPCDLTWEEVEIAFLADGTVP